MSTKNNSEYRRTRENSDLGYVVLPAAHGKSYNHERIPNLLEIDQIYNCNGDGVLRHLRLEAKKTGYWEKYDLQWANIISEILPRGRLVIMVPAISIGEKLKGKFLGNGKLKDSQWRENLSARGKTIEDYTFGSHDDFAQQIFETNEELQEWLIQTASSWICKEGTIAPAAATIRTDW